MQKSGYKQTFLYESGQALVLVLLSLSVVLTVVLFVLARSVTDISTSTEQADSVRAFSAAEAGIEKALITGSNYTNVSIGNNALYSVTVSDYSEGQTTFNYPSVLLSGDTMTLWFWSHNQDGSLAVSCTAAAPCFTGNSLKICWGKDSSKNGTTPAIEVSVYYETTPGDLSTVRIGRGTYDPYKSGRITQNSFADFDGDGCTIDQTTYGFRKTINSLSADLGVPAGSRLLFAKIRMLYNTSVGQNIGFDVSSSGSTLPSQGQEIVSTGSAGSTGTESNRRVSVFKGWPEFFFSGIAIFSPTGVVKQ